MKPNGNAGTTPGDDTSPEQREMSIASVIAEFLKNIPPGLDAGTLLAEVQRIAGG